MTMFSTTVLMIFLGLSMRGFAQVEDVQKIIAEVGTTVTIPANLTFDETEIIIALVWKHEGNDIVTLSPGMNLTVYQSEYQGRALVAAEDYKLMLNGLVFTDSGAYEFSSVTTKGSDSVIINLEILASPIVSTRPLPITDERSETEQVLAECIAKAGSSPFTIEWYDGELLVADTTSSVDTENAGNELLIDSVLQLRLVPNASRDNGRILTCVVGDALGRRLVKDVTLEVTEPTTTVQTTTMQAYPMITKFPQSKTITLVLGKSRVLSCKATGVPNPSVTWYKDDVQLKSGVGECRLDVIATDYSVSGKYKCVASNGEGSNNEELDIDVQGPPKIVGLDSLANQTEKYVLQTGDEFVRLSCQSDAYPRPAIEWRVEGANLTDLEAKHESVSSDGSSSSNLNISSKHFSGPNPISKIFCSAKNHHGEATKAFVVTIPSVAASNIGLVVGIVVAMVLLIVVISIIAYFAVVKKRRQKTITEPESGGLCSGWSTCCGASVKSKELKEEDDIVTVEHVKEVSEEGTNDEKQKLTEAEEKPANEEEEKKEGETPEEEGDKDGEEKPKKNKKKISLPMQCCKGKKKEKKTDENETEKETEEGAEEKETVNGDTKTTEQTEKQDDDRDSGKGDTLGKALEDDSQKK